MVRIDSYRFENNFMIYETVRSGLVPLRFVSSPVYGFIWFYSVWILELIMLFFIKKIYMVVFVVILKQYPLVFLNI